MNPDDVIANLKLLASTAFQRASVVPQQEQVLVAG